ncbi:DUF4129 domain-containing protein [Natrialba sp. PRR66]|uniref:DUF4129 domain-containing protein n=1 Tax=Natrialba sp. PRR66 TaxID=3098146 RepID=UPI002B1D49DA|nr:DUF4129 domain-containing protein [Natrialba sp. PRR66]
MRQNRSVLIATALLSILTLGVTASVLETTPITASYDVSAESSAPGGLSILDVLLLLVVAFFDLFGIEFDPAILGTGTGSWAGGFGLLLALLRSAALPLVGIGAAVAVLLLVGRRVPESSAAIGLSALATRRRSATRSARSDETSESWPPAEPESGVAKAWVEMTEPLEPDRPHCRTPTEWAETAIDAGFDESAVTTVTELFRETRYGEAAETTAYRRKARRELERLDGDSE